MCLVVCVWLYVVVCGGGCDYVFLVLSVVVCVVVGVLLCAW